MMGGSVVENKMCCGFGHRDVFKDIVGELKSILEDWIVNNGVGTFMTGGMGDFDLQFAKAVRELKCQYPYIELVLIKPYFTNDLNTNKVYYESMYDSVLIPDVLMGVHYKSAIKLRNRWMIERCDCVLVYVNREFGGAYDALKYARKQGKTVIHLSQK
ncbi:MAG: DUF1273 domain-containing protein [Ruminococcaceae bacterium]|nr:DUF1273 domain-containing protein [Oscillospiraceae bacterium]